MRSLSIVGACLLLAFSAALVLQTERGAMQAAGRAFAGPVPLGIRAALPLPYSPEATALLAGRCTVSLGPGRTELFADAVAAATVRHCAEFADRALAMFPREPRLWLLKAAVAQRRSNGRAMARALILAQAGAPLQSWQSEQRLVLLASALRSGPDLPGWDEIARADIEALLLSQSGAEFLAAHYAAGSELQPLIALALETAAPQNQRRMVNLIGTRLNK